MAKETDKRYVCKGKISKLLILLSCHLLLFFCSIFGPTTSFTYTKETLVAYMEYEFRLVAENSFGATRSDWVTAVTRQDSEYICDILSCVCKTHC